MKTLIIFYSRTGNTKKIALEIKSNLKADIEEIKDKERKGILGYFHAGKEAFLNRLVDIEYKKDVKNYDLIIVGTPIWASTMCPAIRTYLVQNKNKLKNKKIAFFCTLGGNGYEKAFKQMQEITHKPINTFYISTPYKWIEKSDYKNKVKEFCKSLK